MQHLELDDETMEMATKLCDRCHEKGYDFGVWICPDVSDVEEPYDGDIVCCNSVGGELEDVVMGAEMIVAKAILEACRPAKGDMGEIAVVVEKAIRLIQSMPDKIVEMTGLLTKMAVEEGKMN